MQFKSIAQKKEFKWFLLTIIVIVPLLIFSVNAANHNQASDENRIVDKKQSNESVQKQAPIAPSVMALTPNPMLGTATPKLKLIEYSDYYCPYCGVMHQESILPIVKKYGDQIQFESKMVAVMSEQSYISAHAAFCANENDKYWEISDKFFDRVKPLMGKPKTKETYSKLKALMAEGTPDYLTKIAATVEGINIDEFASCMNSNRYRSRIETNIAEYKRLGTRGVPVLIINNKMLPGYVPYDQLETIIQSELAK